MTDIINLILVIIGAVLIFRFSLWLIRRIGLIIKLSYLKKTCKAKVKYLRFPFLPTFMMSEKADIEVEILDTVYLLRL